jgi:hypothetical protein
MPRNRPEPKEAKIKSHVFAAREAISLLSHHLVSTFLLLTFVCVLLALPLTLIKLFQNVNYVSDHLNKNAVINLYLKVDARQSDVDTLISELRLRHDVLFEQYISPKTGLKEFEEQSGLSDLTQYLKQNPIPGVIVLKPTQAENSLEAINQLVGSLNQLPNIDNVAINTQWLSHAYALLHSLNKTLIIFTVIVYILVLVITTTLLHMMLPLFEPKRPYLTIIYLGTMLGVVNGSLSDFIVGSALGSLKELLSQLTFIDTALPYLQLSDSSLLFNLCFAIFTMILSGCIVHKYRARVGE